MLAQFVYEDGAWVVDGDRRQLRSHGRAVPLGSRAFEIVERLAEAAGHFVDRAELVAHVWPGVTVEENTLRVHIHAIRKALGPDRTLLKTSSGRGYQLLGRWTTRGANGNKDNPAPLGSAQKPDQSVRSNLPSTVSELIGRDAALQELRDMVSAFRIVTLTGPGGIGKTTLAVELARRLVGEFDGSACLVELASLADPELLPSAVMAAMGLTGESNTITLDEVARAIGATKLLLVLDNCEHVIESAARFVEAIVRGCPNVSLVATSREFLRSEGERVYRVSGLQVPGWDEGSVNQLATYSAVELFVARTKALDDRFALDPVNLSAVAAISRRLDGIPLAIELAASRAATLGVHQVASSLKNRLDLLTGSRRTSLPRHRTLRAALDWSYELLPDEERRLLRCLAIFPGLFDLGDAAAVVQGDDLIDGLSNLIEKSLVIAETRGKLALYKLLGTTRLYALEKLGAAGEREAASRRHADYYRELLERLESGWSTRRPTIGAPATAGGSTMCGPHWTGPLRMKAMFRLAWR